MAKITEARIGYRRAVQVKTAERFDTMTVSVDFVATLDAEDDLAVVVAEMLAQAKEQAKQQMIPLFKKQADKATEVFGNLPAEIQQEIINAHLRTNNESPANVPQDRNIAQGR